MTPAAGVQTVTGAGTVTVNGGREGGCCGGELGGDGGLAGAGRRCGRERFGRRTGVREERRCGAGVERADGAPLAGRRVVWGEV